MVRNLYRGSISAIKEIIDQDPEISSWNLTWEESDSSNTIDTLIQGYVFPYVSRENLGSSINETSTLKYDLDIQYSSDEQVRYSFSNLPYTSISRDIAVAEPLYSIAKRKKINYGGREDTVHNIISDLLYKKSGGNDIGFCRKLLVDHANSQSGDNSKVNFLSILPKKWCQDLVEILFSYILIQKPVEDFQQLFEIIQGEIISNYGRENIYYIIYELDFDTGSFEAMTIDFPVPFVTPGPKNMVFKNPGRGSENSRIIQVNVDLITNTSFDDEWEMISQNYSDEEDSPVRDDKLIIKFSLNGSKDAAREIAKEISSKFGYLLLAFINDNNEYPVNELRTVSIDQDRLDHPYENQRMVEISNGVFFPYNSFTSVNVFDYDASVYLLGNLKRVFSLLSEIQEKYEQSDRFRINDRVIDRRAWYQFYAKVFTGFLRIGISYTLPIENDKIQSVITSLEAVLLDSFNSANVTNRIQYVLTAISNSNYRLQNYNYAKDIYKLRSRTVHGDFSSIYGKDKPYMKDHIKSRENDWTVYRTISSVGLTFIVQYLRLILVNFHLLGDFRGPTIETFFIQSIISGIAIQTSSENSNDNGDQEEEEETDQEEEVEG